MPNSAMTLRASTFFYRYETAFNRIKHINSRCKGENMNYILPQPRKSLSIDAPDPIHFSNMRTIMIVTTLKWLFGNIKSQLMHTNHTLK